jgi:TetR/AcrR family transcriptional regulator, tetracycline repressor protein
MTQRNGQTKAPKLTDTTDVPIRRGRGGVQLSGLSEEKVLQAALKVTRNSGLQNLTIRGVADELGVSPPAIYHYVGGGKDELAGMVVDRVVTTVHRDQLVRHAHEGWRTALERVILTVEGVEREFPGVSLYLLSTGYHRPTTRNGSEFVVQMLLAGGFTPEAAAQCHDAIVSFVTGWAVTCQPPASPAKGHPAKGHPALGEALERIADMDSKERLRIGLRALVTGLCATLLDSPE